ncbi:MAG TPA: cell envelope protein, partial [Mycobacterium sp.]|nr:cell envelope protein [Mycobacterium sp.]
MKLRAVLAAVLLIALTAGCSGTNKAKETTSASAPPTSSTAAGAVTPKQARAIAKDAYIYGFPMVDSYR